jgi:MFS transporter, DHA1 family, inner membrane transport protein
MTYDGSEKPVSGAEKPVSRANTRAIGTLAALSVSTFTYVTTETLPIGLLLLIAADLDASPSAVGRLVTAYGLVVVLVSVPLTVLTRKVPRRYLLSALLAVFVLATLLSLLAESYWILLATRVAIALTQALFWSVATPTAAGLFPPQVRGRVLAVLFAGPAVASVFGVPAGTWLGQLAGWRAPFLVLSAVGLVALIVIAVLLPTAPPEQSHAARGARPDARRYWLLVVTTMLAVAGAFTSYTYVSPFLLQVTGFSAAAIGPLLMLRGVVGIAGIGLAGSLSDRRPWLAVVLPVALQALALLGLYAAGQQPVFTAALLGLSGVAMAGLVGALSTRVLEVAPGDSSVASAGMSTAFNVGITAGALLGSVLLPAYGVRSTALVGGLLSVAALAAVLAEPLVARRPGQRMITKPEPAVLARVP